MEKGIIYLIFSMLIKLFTSLNAVEWFKGISKKIFINEDSSKKELDLVRRLSVDIFIILKYLLVIYAFLNPSVVFVYLVGYLAFSNIFTYFYYHVWDLISGIDTESKRRRFINLLLSLIFNILVFAFFYKYLAVPLKIDDEFGYLILSLMNTFMLGSDILKDASFELGYYQMLFTVQALMSFGFLSIILSNTVIGENDGV